MTIQEAKNILLNNWDESIFTDEEGDKKEDFDFIVGDLVQEIFDEDPYYGLPFINCYIFKFAMFKKGKKPNDDDWGECGVFKADGKIIPVINFG